MLNVVVAVKFCKGEISPFDGAALECALSVDGAKVTVIGMTPQSALPCAEYLTRLNVDKVILISDNLFAGSDTLVTSKILSRAIKPLNPDMVLCGRQSIDGDTAQVPPELAELLGFSFIPYAMSFATDKIQTRLGEKNVVLPCVISVEKIKTPRTPSFRSVKKTVEIIDNTTLGFKPCEVGLSGSPTKVIKSYPSALGRRKCEFISGKELKDVIKRATVKPDGANIDRLQNVTEKKLDDILIIGGGLEKTAEKIARKVTRFYSEDCAAICEKILSSGIKNVLFKCSLKNRALAPRIAARLNAGLCADCIDVDTDGERLYMTRPAASGNVIADITSTSEITMATVRESGEARTGIMFCIGYGAKDYIDKIKGLAMAYGAEVVATRKAVDFGLMPYESQVGLTGRVVNPKVYVAFGVSGKIQHVVGMNESATVIAVDKDGKSEIFDYADYGVKEDIENVEL